MPSSLHHLRSRIFADLPDIIPSSSFSPATGIAAWNPLNRQRPQPDPLHFLKSDAIPSPTTIGKSSSFESFIRTSYKNSRIPREHPAAAPVSSRRQLHVPNRSKSSTRSIPSLSGDYLL